MRCLLAACCLLAGCDRVFGVDFAGPDAASDLDLDEDGIRDIDDDCIRAPEDLLGDEDGSAPPNGEDECPLDWTHGEDEDSDSLPVQCDPLPNVGFDGQRRCFMAFASGSLNSRLWYARDGLGWSPSTGELLYQDTSELTYTMMPVQPLRVARTTTVDALFEVTEANSLTELTLWVTANDPQHTAPAGDAGCTLEVDSDIWVIRVRGSGQRNPVAVTVFMAPAQFRIRATYVPGALESTLVCEAQLLDSPWFRSEAAVVFPPTGTIGFGGRSGTFKVQALDILEHP